MIEIVFHYSNSDLVHTTSCWKNPWLLRLRIQLLLTSIKSGTCTQQLRITLVPDPYFFTSEKISDLAINSAKAPPCLPFDATRCSGHFFVGWSRPWPGLWNDWHGARKQRRVAGEGATALVGNSTVIAGRGSGSPWPGLQLFLWLGRPPSFSRSAMKVAKPT